MEHDKPSNSTSESQQIKEANHEMRDNIITRKGNLVWPFDSVEMEDELFYSHIIYWWLRIVPRHIWHIVATDQWWRM